MLKNLSEKSLKMIEKNFLYSKKTVSYNGNIDRRTHINKDPRDITDDNIDDRIDKFADVINTSRMYRTPLRYFCDLGKNNFLVKIDFKIRCNLDADMKKLFETKTSNNNRRERCANNFHKSSIYPVRTSSFNKKFQALFYLKTRLISTKILRMGIQNTPLQKTYEMQIGSQSFKIDFLGANRQFDLVEISLVYYKSNKLQQFMTATM